MLQAIRDRATGWIAYGIIILICIPFAFWGVNSYFDGGVQLDAAEVGDTAITLQEVQRAYQQQRSRLQSLMGANFNPALFSEDTLKHQALQQLIDNTVLIQTADTQGMRVGDQQLQHAIQEIGVFQENGRFNTERYQRMLRVQGYTPFSFEENLRQELMTNQLRDGLISSSLLTRAEIEEFAKLLHQKRDISYLLLSLDNYKNNVEVEDSEIEAYFEENKNRFMSPEQVKLQYLELTLDQIAKDINVSDEELQTAYEEQIDQYTQEEERKASHILFSVSEDAPAETVDEIKQLAQQLYDDLKSEAKTFDQALTDANDQENVEAGELGVIYQGMMEATFEDALYALEKAGDITEPVKTASGFHIIRLDELKPEVVKSFAEAKEELTKSVQLQRAETYFFDAAENLANLSFESPDSLQPAADSLGLEIAESDWITRTVTGESEDSIARFNQVIQAAFSIDVVQNGMNSEPLEVEPSHIIVIRKLDHQEPAPLNLEQAREDIIAQLKEDKAREALNQDTASLLERVQQGESLEALATEIDAEITTTGLIGRTESSVNSAIRTEAFRLSANEEGDSSFSSATLSNGDQAIIAVNQVELGKMEDIEQSEQDALVQRLTSEIGLAQFDGLLQNRRQQTDIVTYNDRL